MQNRIIYNNLIPFKGYLACAVFPFILARKDEGELDRYSVNHERIHLHQQAELLVIGFYLVYLFEWLFRLITDGRKAYRNISFEREAYQYQNDLDYLKRRKPFAQWRR